MKTKSHYPTNSILEKTDQLSYIANNISLNAGRAKSVRSLRSSFSRPRSSSTCHLGFGRRDIPDAGKNNS